MLRILCKLIIITIITVSYWASTTLNNGGSNAWDYYSIQIETNYTTNYTLIRVD